METEKEEDSFSTVTLVAYVQAVPGFDTVTLYDPAVNPDMLDPACPFDQV